MWYMNSVQTVLISSYDPMFLKSLYGMLREAGFEVETSENPAGAVQKTLARDYLAVVMDSESVGLPATDAARLIKNTSPGVTVVISGDAGTATGAISVKRPLDLEELKSVILEIKVKAGAGERRASST